MVYTSWIDVGSMNNEAELVAICLTLNFLILYDWKYNSSYVEVKSDICLAVSLLMLKWSPYKELLVVQVEGILGLICREQIWVKFSWIPCKGLTACAMPAQHSAALCCVTLCVPHCACRHMGKVQQCLLGQQHFGIGCLDCY